MSRAWAQWLGWMGQTVDPRPLALVRIAVPVCILADLARLAQLGLLSAVYTPFDRGGLNRTPSPHAVMENWFGDDGAWIALAVTVICMLLVATGRWMRPAIVVGVLAYAQLGHIFPPGDRAIDRLLRTVLLVLLFSGANGAFAWGTERLRRVPAWPMHFLRLFLALVYTSAGIAKLIQQPGWVSLRADPPLLRILIDPMASTLDPAFWAQFPDLFRVLGMGVIVLELTSVLLVTRWGPFWALGGVLMHAGIWATMALGMFSPGMLAVYPVLLAPWVIRGLDRADPSG